MTRTSPPAAPTSASSAPPLFAVFPVELALDLPLASWAALFETFGLPSALAGDAAPATLAYDAVLDVLRAPRLLPPPLRDALTSLASLGTDAGRAALREAAVDLAVDLARLPGPAPSRPCAVHPPDLAARVLMANAAGGDPRLGALLDRALTRVARIAWPKPTRLFRNVAPGPALVPIPALVDEVARALAALSAGNGFPTEVAVDVMDDASPTSLRLRTSRFATRFTRTSDLVRIELARGRMFVTSADPEAVEILRRAVGRALAADEDLFPRAPTCGLSPLQERGRRGLHASSMKASITRVRMIYCTWDSGDDDVLQEQGRDCFSALERRAQRIAGGHLTSVTLRIELATGSPSRADIRVRPPFGVDLPEGPLASMCEDYLDAIGLTPYRAPRSDLWALEPWIHSPSSLRSALGDADFDALQAAGLFEPVQVRAIAHPDFPGAGRVLLAFPLPPRAQQFYGASNHEDIPSRTIEADELTLLRLDVAALARHLARALLLEGDVALIEGGGLYDLGRRRFGDRAEVRVYFAPGAPSEADKAHARAVTSGARPVVLVPPGRTMGEGIAEVQLPGLAGPLDGLARALVVAARLGDEVEAVHLAPPDVRLVIDTRAHHVWLDGLPIEGLSDTAFRYVDLLAQHAGRAVPKEKVQRQLSPRRRSDGVERTTKLRAMKAFRLAFEREARAVPADLDDLFLVDGQGHRVGVRVFRR